MPGFIHHIEWCVSDLAKHERDLVDCYGFEVIAQRELKSQLDQETVLIRQKVLRSGLTVFLLTENNCHDPISHSDEEGYPYLTCCATRSDHKRDTVFNVCLQVGNVEKVTAKVLEVSLQQATDSGGATQSSSSGEGIVVIPPVNPLGGSFIYSVVRSCCGNVIHSLISGPEERGGDFLPGFRHVGANICSDLLTTHMDHVTYVCKTGETRSILKWYSSCFGMERFLINSQETLEDDGVEIGEEVGMRMTVGEWISSWLCSEEGVQLDPATTDDRMNFKLVIAEPLKGRHDSHVQQFIDSHDGPGLQHIGLSVKGDVSRVVGVMMTKGAKFRNPPPAYYRLENKVSEILHAGEDLEEFKNRGILIDAEANFFCKATQTSSANYLMQIFTRPLFDQNTFFLEVLERRGARGFGAGNIRALARSIIMQEEMEQQAAGIV